MTAPDWRRERLARRRQDVCPGRPPLSGAVRRVVGRRGRLAGAQPGYVLLTVLAALVVLSLVALRLDDRVQAWRAARAEWSGWQAERQTLASASQTLMACLLLRPLGPRGFGPEPGVLRVDGRAYRLPSGVAFSVQDVRGLISVAEPLPELLKPYLAAASLPAREVDALIDTLADFTDADDLRRLNGAEASAYAEAGLPAPRNDWLNSPYELRNVLGWNAHPMLWERASDWASAVRQPWVNPNTAPVAVLRALPGATPAGVAALLATREMRHITGAADLFAVSGITLEDDLPQFNPGVIYRLRLWQPGGVRMLEYTVMLTLTAPALPWATLEMRTLPRVAEGVGVAAVPDPLDNDPFTLPRRDRPDPDPRDPEFPLACADLAPA